jgi:hypothetical protein
VLAKLGLNSKLKTKGVSSRPTSEWLPGGLLAQRPGDGLDDLDGRATIVKG